MINLQKETSDYIATLLERWDEIKSKTIPKGEQSSYSSEFDGVLGHIWWDNPNILWLLITENEEGYEGSQTQIGLTKDGRIMWEYQSHCSCNGYENSHEHGEELDWSKKTYELNSIPQDWEVKIQENAKKLLAL